MINIDFSKKRALIGYIEIIVFSIIYYYVVDNYIYRFSVILLLLPTIIILTMIWQLKPILFKFLLKIVLIIHLFLILVPYDICIWHKGELGINVVPVVYGVL